MMPNVVKCVNCKAPLINEEVAAHQCFTKRAVSVTMDGNGHWFLFDGKNWYRWFPERATEKSTRERDTGGFNSSQEITDTMF